MTWVHRVTNINVEEMTGDCAGCGPGIRLKRKKNKSGNYGFVCRTAQRRHRGRQSRGRQLAGSAFDQAVIDQQGRCAICGDLMDTVCTDHCHTRDRFRALLCRTCNVGLGMFRDDPKRLNAAIEYLHRHNSA